MRNIVLFPRSSDKISRSPLFPSPSFPPFLLSFSSLCMLLSLFIPSLVCTVFFCVWWKQLCHWGLLIGAMKPLFSVLASLGDLCCCSPAGYFVFQYETDEYLLFLSAWRPFCLAVSLHLPCSVHLSCTFHRAMIHWVVAALQVKMLFSLFLFSIWYLQTELVNLQWCNDAWERLIRLASSPPLTVS